MTCEIRCSQQDIKRLLILWTKLLAQGIQLCSHDCHSVAELHMLIRTNTLERPGFAPVTHHAETTKQAKYHESTSIAVLKKAGREAIRDEEKGMGTPDIKLHTFHD